MITWESSDLVFIIRWHRSSSYICLVQHLRDLRASSLLLELLHLGDVVTHCLFLGFSCKHRNFLAITICEPKLLLEYMCPCKTLVLWQTTKFKLPKIQGSDKYTNLQQPSMHPTWPCPSGVICQDELQKFINKQTCKHSCDE